MSALVDRLCRRHARKLRRGVMSAVDLRAERMNAIRIGDAPRFGLRADCSSRLSAPSRGGDWLCTEDAGHQRGDIPHVACGSKVCAIWDDIGNFVTLRDGDGATL